MTALTQYSRLEATALWRPTLDAQRREVIVSIGDATLVIATINDQALTHWSLAAVVRANPAVSPAVFHPDGDPSETLEFSDDAAEMVEAIEKLRANIAKRRPRKGRLRVGILLLSLVTVLALGVFWLPNAILTHTLSIVPEAKRAQIGNALLTHIKTMTGTPCDDPAGLTSLNVLSKRLFGQADDFRLTVVPSSLDGTLHLPGRRILVGRALTEDPEVPEVLAGYILAEVTRMAQEDPLGKLLKHAGTIETFRLLTTGMVGNASLKAFAEFTLTAPQREASQEALLASFKAAKVHSSPYGYALDTAGDLSLALIEADPFHGTNTPTVLSDANWVRVQNICGY